MNEDTRTQRQIITPATSSSAFSVTPSNAGGTPSLLPATKTTAMFWDTTTLLRLPLDLNPI